MKAKFVVCMKNAVDRAGRKTVAFIGDDFYWTGERQQAHLFDELDAERFANHWKNRYRGFAGGADIQIEEAA